KIILAYFYHKNDDLQKALELFDDASYENGLACQFLAVHYSRFQNNELFEKYAKRGHDLGDKECSFIYAKIFLVGLTVEKNIKKGIELLESINTSDSNSLLAE